MICSLNLIRFYELGNSCVSVRNKAQEALLESTADEDSQWDRLETSTNALMWSRWEGLLRQINKPHIKTKFGLILHCDWSLSYIAVQSTNHHAVLTQKFSPQCVIYFFGVSDLLVGIGTNPTTGRKYMIYWIYSFY